MSDSDFDGTVSADVTDAERARLLGRLRAGWVRADPVPNDLVRRMQRVAAAEAELVRADLDYELMLLLERSREAAGARSHRTSVPTSYTLRFGTDDVDLLLRVSTEESGSARLDGWTVPAAPALVRVSDVEGSRSWTTEVDQVGRFELAGLPRGLYRLWISVGDTDDGAGSAPTSTLGTPSFEV